MAYRVTALIPVYNGESHLSRAIQSALNQTRPVDEVIVVDDGSTDRTAEVAQSFGARVRYLPQPNRGVSAARNFGIQQAQCEWIAFLDHDDEWVPDKMQLQMAALEANPNASLCYSDYWWAALSGERQLERLPLKSLHHRMRFRNPFPVPVVVANRAKVLELGGFNERLKGAEDWDLFIRIILSHEVIAVDQPLAIVYESLTSASTNTEMMLSHSLSAVESSLLAGLTGLTRVMWRRRIKCSLYYSAALSARAAGAPAMGYLVHSLWQWPFPDIRPARWTSPLLFLRPARTPDPQTPPKNSA